MNELFKELFARYTRWSLDSREVPPLRDAAFLQWARLETDKFCPMPASRGGSMPEIFLERRLQQREVFMARLERDYDEEHGLMTKQITDVVVSDPAGSFPRYSIALHDEPGGNPMDPKWKGSWLRFNGIGKEDLLGIMRRVIARLEAGEELWDISRP